MARFLALILLLPWFLVPTRGAPVGDIERPNVILFMADDMGMGDTSAYQDFTGNADEVQVATPQMERLARMGIRFTDAHTPASRCSPTRYALLTGRYAWRNRLKHWVLFGVQGDPMIEADRPTLATLFRDHGYGTAMVGKWHVGLRYRQSDGRAAAGWEDADLTKPLFDGPIDHGFDYARFTSRSHGTSGPDAGAGGKGRRQNGPDQGVGPGHLHENNAIGATGMGKTLVSEGEHAYVLTKLGSRHSDHAIERLETHRAGGTQAEKPFFLYYPANSNHGPYTPDDAIGGVPVKGAARTKAGQPMDARHDFIYENDVALGRLIDYLEAHDDPRHPDRKLIETTIVIFTSDNGAEKDSDVATGPFRSHKGSCFEGGHRVPFIVSWGAGGIGDGNADTPGATSDQLIGLTDLFATFADLMGVPLPELAAGGKGAEDSISLLGLWKGGEWETPRPPLFFHDHKESRDDPAVAAMRLDSPRVGARTFEGKWKIFFDASLIRFGRANPFALYELTTDQREENNRLDEPELKPLVEHLKQVAIRHRTIGGHRLDPLAAEERVTFHWGKQPVDSPHSAFHPPFHQQPFPQTFGTPGGELELTLSVSDLFGDLPRLTFHENANGLGIAEGKFAQVDGNETLAVSFDRDVIVESVGIVAGNGVCGGFYQVGSQAPLAIYCVDADIDEREQNGLLSDIGLLRAGETLLLSSSPHLGVETPGQWRLGSITIRPVAGEAPSSHPRQEGN